MTLRRKSISTAASSALLTLKSKNIALPSSPVAQTALANAGTFNNMPTTSADVKRVAANGLPAGAQFSVWFDSNGAVTKVVYTPTGNTAVGSGSAEANKDNGYWGKIA